MVVEHDRNVDWSKGAAWIGGNILPLDAAAIPLRDWGFLRSDVTYDSLHVWKGLFFRLDDHVERFEASMRKLRMSLPDTSDDIKARLKLLVRKTGLRDAYVCMICTRGTAIPGLPRHPANCENRFYAYVMPFIWTIPLEIQQRGVKAIIPRTHRIPPESVDPTVKNYHWGDLMRSIFEASDAGSDTAILQDGNGYVTEGPGFNVFAVCDGVVITPDRGVLEGITRKSVCEICDKLGIPRRTERLSVERLRNADEVFVTSTPGGVIPIAQLDNRIIGDGRPGPMTEKLKDTYWRLHDEGWHGTPVDYA